MDINKLKKKSQLNVQEQNALNKHRILQEALYWRENGIPSVLKNIFEKNKINTEKSIYLEYEQDFPGICTDEGTIVTPEGEFYEFEADLNKERTKIIEFYFLKNITSKIEVNKHKPGTGETWGYLALEALSEVNKC